MKNYKSKLKNYKIIYFILVFACFIFVSLSLTVLMGEKENGTIFNLFSIYKMNWNKPTISSAGVFWIIIYCLLMVIAVGYVVKNKIERKILCLTISCLVALTMIMAIGLSAYPQWIHVSSGDSIVSACCSWIYIPFISDTTGDIRYFLIYSAAGISIVVVDTVVGAFLLFQIAYLTIKNYRRISFNE
jgi:hypothetical protein